ncbi:MAG: aquaporin [Ignavibacteria bacterium]|nr:aquaporin [Ignavibacteria bacterium]
MIAALKTHWPEYLMEAGGLGIFLISASVFRTLLEHPESPVHMVIHHGDVRRALMGCLMGLTAIGIVYSPWGKQSGAHLNPALTLTFLSMGKIRSWDAIFYILAQFVGGIGGIVVARLVLGSSLGHPAVNYVATKPGALGVPGAFAGEFVISFVLFLTVLAVSNSHRNARRTGIVVGFLIAMYITVEAPLSGMSMNPARTFGSAVALWLWTSVWIYFVAPPLAMLAASRLYLRFRREPVPLACPKMHHENEKRCIFCGKPEGTLHMIQSNGS